MIGFHDPDAVEDFPHENVPEVIFPSRNESGVESSSVELSDTTVPC